MLTFLIFHESNSSVIVISYKVTYMSLLLLKLRTLELEIRAEGRQADCKLALQTVEDMVLGSYLCQIVSSQVTSF